MGRGNSINNKFGWINDRKSKDQPLFLSPSLLYLYIIIIYWGSSMLPVDMSFPILFNFKY